MNTSATITYPPQTPENLVLTTLAKYRRENDTFRFVLKLRNTSTNREMEFPYSGGCQAFLTPEPLHPEATPEVVAAHRLASARATKIRKLLNSRIAEDHRAGMEQAFALANPSLASVLWSLVNDTRAGEETFPNFCSEFGYDEDSRAAFATWQACQDNAAKFRAVVGADFTKIERILADY